MSALGVAVPATDGLRGVVERLEGRRAAVVAAGPELWQRYRQLVLRVHGDPVRAAVLANVVGLAAIDHPEDRADLAVLVEELGHQEVGRLQEALLAELDPAPGRPLTTAVVRGLGHAEGPGEAVAVVCHRAARWLVLAGIRPDTPRVALPITTAADITHLLAHATVEHWRQQLAVIADNPWSPEVLRLQKLADEAGLPGVGAAIRHASDLMREQHELAERMEVAHQIRILVRSSGVSQRTFAQYIGTSASRLSTYVTGTVTPSAAMLLRITRTARALERAGDRRLRRPRQVRQSA